MREDTVKAAWHDLYVAGVRIDTLWRVVAGEWSRRTHKGGEIIEPRNPLYAVIRASGKGRPGGWRVHLQPDAPTLTVFDSIIDADPQYRHEHQRGIVFAEDTLPRRRVRQDVCWETPYNVVVLGERSERALRYLEGTRVKFNVEMFRDDYQRITEFAKTAYWPKQRDDEHPDRLSCVPDDLRDDRKRRAFLAAYRRVYRQTEGVPFENRSGQAPDGSDHRALSGYRWIKTRFFRAKNRCANGSYAERPIRGAYVKFPAPPPGPPRAATTLHPVHDAYALSA